jgi:endonuclease-3
MKSEEALSIFFEISRMFPQARCELVHSNELELLVAIILSAQTTDEAVNRVTPELFSRFRTLEDYAHADPAEIGGFIRHLGLFQNKARYLHEACRMVLDRFDGKIPSDPSDLESLPGVGRKTANVFLSEWHKIPRIAVDTHVSRVSFRLGFCEKNDSPVTIEKKLMSLFPESIWIALHHQLIFFGRYFCTSRSPACERCPFFPICRDPHPKKPSD